MHFRFQAEQFMVERGYFFITLCLEWKALSLIHEALNLISQF